MKDSKTGKIFRHFPEGHDGPPETFVVLTDAYESSWANGRVSCRFVIWENGRISRLSDDRIGDDSDIEM